VHQGPEDREFARLLGAQAATHGRDIFLADGESASDPALMRHELAHVAAGGEEVMLRSATWFERRMWLGFFDHYLPRMFLNNYMDDTGARIVLTKQEMIDCNPIVDLRRSTAFMSKVADLMKAGGGTAAITMKGWGGALTNGTLGNFTITYTGTVAVKPDGSWVFTGTMTFHDFWDFDPKGSGSGRSSQGELKVRVANLLLPGKPFDIDSVAVDVTQSDKDARATWGSSKPPVNVPDNARSGAADIGGTAAAGAAGGDFVAGPLGGAVGGAGGADVGTQESEDLHK